METSSVLAFYARPNVTKYQVYQFFYVDEKFTHRVIYFYVKLKIYTSSLLPCYQLPIILAKKHICRSSLLL